MKLMAYSGTHLYSHTDIPKKVILLYCTELYYLHEVTFEIVMGLLFSKFSP